MTDTGTTEASDSGPADQTIPSVAKFLKIRDNALRKLNADSDQARTDYYANRLTRREWGARVESCRTEADQTIRSAWTELGQSPEPFIAWMATDEDVSEYRGEVETILRMLTRTTTLDDLENLADEERWCGEWQRLRDAAIDAGVLPERGQELVAPAAGAAGNPLTEQEQQALVEQQWADATEAVALVAQFYQDREKATSAYHAAKDGLDPDDIGYWDERDLLSATHNTAYDTAWKMLRNSRFRLLAWIATNVGDFAETQTVLRSLNPDTTLSDLDTLAEEHGWCGAWDRLRTQAVREGAVPRRGPVLALVSRPAEAPKENV